MISAKIPNFYIRSSLFTVLSLGGAMIGYLMYPLLARILGLSEFGDFATVIALSNQALGFLLAFNVVSVYVVKHFPEETARQNVQTIQKVLIWVFLALCGLLFLMSPLLKQLLKIDHSYSFLVLGLILLISVPIAIWTGYLQGHKEMVRIGIYSLGVAITKLVGTITLALLFGFAGGLWGFLVGMVMGIFILRFSKGVALPHLQSIFNRLSSSEKKFLSGFMGYLGMSLVVVGSLTILQNLDLVLAKSLFSPEDAGRYAGVSVLSNIVYYLLFLIIWIVLPEIDVNSRETNRRLLLTSYKIILAALVVIVGLELLIGEHLVALLLGGEFTGQVSTLIITTLFRITLIAVTLYAFYLLVLRKKKSLILIGLVLLSSFTLPRIFSSTPLQMITTLWLSLLFSFVMYWIIEKCYKDKKNE